MYHALYRKYRPNDFDSVVGQDAIIKALTNSIKNKNFSHAYIFFGPRGTGKTTVSKIFARNINCLSPVDGIACKKCAACEFSFSKDCVDIIEIDAASNNGVDEIRDLRNNISLVPSELKYKVYIIDEVHMLSTGAFNALLKTLEEPPDHVVFILATTDPQKVPDTIISRCQTFSFKRISDDIIEKRLEYVCKNENIKIDSNVLKKIAVLSDGGLRDALGSLDKLLSYTSDEITLDDFNDVNGVISDSELNDFIHSIMRGDIAKVLSDITIFNNNGKNLIQVLIQIVDYTRNLIVNYYLNKDALDFSVDLLQEFITQLNEKMFDIKKSGNTKVFIEMFILKFINDFVFCEKNIDTVQHVSSKNSVNGSSAVQSDNVKNKSIDDGTVHSDNFKINDVSKITSTVQEHFGNNVISSEIDSQTENNNLDEEFSLDSYLSNENDDFENAVELVSDGIKRIINIDEIIEIRVNNTMASAEKNLLKKENELFDMLKEYSFDQEIGYLANSILDSHLCAVGPNDFIISYDSDATVEQNLVNLVKINEVYNKITGSDKNIAIISNNRWNEIRNEYILNLKNNVKYEIKEEPDFIFEEIDNNDIISNSAISLFGRDIVEVE